MDLIRMARHMVGETDDPHEVSTGDNGVTIKFYNDEDPRPRVTGGPEPPQMDLASAQAQLPGAEKPPAPSALTKAATIGASRVGERYQTPSWNELFASENPTASLISTIMGGARPRSVQAQDPMGIDAHKIGAGPPPGLMVGATSEVVDPALGISKAAAHQLLTQLAEKFPHLAAALETGRAGPATVAQEMRGGLGSLAKTVAPGEGAAYALRPSTIARLGHFFELGAEPAATANWEGVTKELLDAFGGNVNAARTYARIWGATSPNTSVPRNTAESISAWLHALQTKGRPLTLEEARAMAPNITMAGSKVPNINRALAGQPLSGDKVEAMAGFMVGDPRTPIDVHALYGIGSTAENLSPEMKGLRALMTGREGLPLRGGLTDTQLYLRYESALQDALKGFDPKRDVNSIFAQTWEGIRAGKGLKPQGGPVDILRAKGLLEVGAMLDPGRLIAALRTKGWTAGAIAGLLAVLKQSQPGVPPTTGSADERSGNGQPAPGRNPGV